MTEQEKMLAGQVYDPSDETLNKLRMKAHRLSQDYNRLYDEEEQERARIMKELLPNCGPGVYLQGPIYFDYGVFTTIGENTFANFNFTVLDTCPVTIGEGSVIGAGSVVTRDIPPHSLAAGNPCRVIRQITEADSMRGL